MYRDPVCAMFEAAELGHKISKQDYKAEEPHLRKALLDLQFDLADRRDFPVILLAGGVDGAGKGSTVNLLNEWMDPRLIATNAMPSPSDEERQRPPMWRFWRALPPKGTIGVFFGSWYTDPIVHRVNGDTSKAALDDHIADICAFERMLADEGALIIKFWFHLSKERQRKRLKSLSKDPDRSWQVTDEDWRRFELYDKFRKTSEHVLVRTSVAHAPWVVIEGSDARYRQVMVGRTLRDALTDRLRNGGNTRPETTTFARTPAAADGLTVLNRLDMSQALTKKEYKTAFESLQRRLGVLSRSKGYHRRSVVLVFEGNDAAGKGGAIRRVTRCLDARFYRVVPVAAPTDEEAAQPYLWRFWRYVPKNGHMTIFDRSWYGRVLVERVEGLCTENDWHRAYNEINSFEEQLTRHGTVVVKFWLAITKDEQEARFKAREVSPLKRHKLTDEDWRNRDKWDDYAGAVCDMVARTSTDYAPWNLVEANNKYFARIKVLRTVVDSIEQSLADS